MEASTFDRLTRMAFGGSRRDFVRVLVAAVDRGAADSGPRRSGSVEWSRASRWALFDLGGL